MWQSWNRAGSWEMTGATNFHWPSACWTRRVPSPGARICNTWMESFGHFQRILYSFRRKFLLPGDSEREMQKEFYSGKHLNNSGAKSKTPLVLHFALLNLHQDLPASLEQPSKRKINQLNVPIYNRLELNAIY